MDRADGESAGIVGEGAVVREAAQGQGGGDRRGRGPLIAGKDDTQMNEFRRTH